MSRMYKKLTKNPHYLNLTRAKHKENNSAETVSLSFATITLYHV